MINQKHFDKKFNGIKVVRFFAIVTTLLYLNFCLWMERGFGFELLLSVTVLFASLTTMIIAWADLRVSKQLWKAIEEDWKKTAKESEEILAYFMKRNKEMSEKKK